MSPPPLPKEPFALRLARHTAALFPRGRSALVRQTARILGCKPSFVAPVGDLQLLIDLNERVSRTLYLFGQFEPEVTALLQALLKPGQVVFDVGANFGYFSLLAARKVGPSGRVFAFEPDPRNLQRLNANIALNGLDNIQIVPLALFDKPGTLSLHLSSESEDNLGSSSLLEQAPDRKPIDVQVETLDHYIAQKGLARVDLVKMDIEGAEFGAIAGAMESLKCQAIGGLLIELHRDILGGPRLQQLVRTLLDFGYTPWRLHGRNPSARQIGEMVEPYDFQVPLSEPNPHFLFTAQSF